MKKFFLLFLIFFGLFIVSADTAEAKKMYAPDLTISQVNLGRGDIIVTNNGNKNSPASGFDVLVYFKKKDGSFQKNFIHVNRVIAPGHSRRFYRVFPNGEKATTGLIRVNPLKRFQEWNYNDNMRYYNMKSRTITSYYAEEFGRYWGTPYYPRKPYGYRYGWAVEYGAGGQYTNRAYSPVISANPVATSWYNRVNKTLVTENIYANLVRIYGNYAGGTSFGYISVSGVPNANNLRVGLEFDWDDDEALYIYDMSYNAAKGIWERYFVGNAWAVTIYSNRTGPESTEDLEHCGNITVNVKTMNNNWWWSS